MSQEQSAEVLAILAEADKRRRKPPLCPDHNFFQDFDEHGRLFQKYKCLNCEVIISTAEHKWYVIGYAQGVASVPV